MYHNSTFTRLSDDGHGHRRPQFYKLFVSDAEQHIVKRFLQNAAGSGQKKECEQSSDVFNSTKCYSTHGSSPIPYLLAGLVAMLALVAFSLFVLACAYWKMLGRCNEGRNFRATNPNVSSAQPIDSRNCLKDDAGINGESIKVVVIMAGEEKPTFLAEPIEMTALDSTE